MGNVIIIRCFCAFLAKTFYILRFYVNNFQPVLLYSHYLVEPQTVDVPVVDKKQGICFPLHVEVDFLRVKRSHNSK